MSSKTAFVRIPHNAYVLVGDGRKALFLRNTGSEIAPYLKTEQVFLDDNPPTREQGTGKPGRSFQSVGSHRSSVEQTDWHDIEEHHFARSVAGALEVLALDKDIPGFVIVAPPRTLAELRHAFGPDIKQRIIAELDKDLTGHPVGDIAKHLAGK